MSDRKLKKDREKLEIQRIILESKTEIKTYMAWNELPQVEQIRIRKAWSSYYEKVKTTPSFKDFFQMKECWEMRNMKKLKELVSRARKRLGENNFQLIKPKEIDPWEFSHGLYFKYDTVYNKIKWIDKQLMGVQDIEKIFS